MAATGPSEQPHVLPWSTALRVPTDGGDVWFKAAVPGLAHEVAVVELLAARRPDVVPPLLGADRERGWMLLADAGERLRELLTEGGDHTDVWLEILPLYAGVQRDLAPDSAELLAAGAPDRRLAVLPAQFEELLADDEALAALTRDERERLAALATRVEADCRELGAFGIPETIQHDDLHDGQVFVREGRFVILDWGDACISQPFFTLVVTLAALAYRLGSDDRDSRVMRCRDAYLDAWTDALPRDELERAYPPAYRLGVLCRGLTWVHIIESIPRPLHELQADAVPGRMRMLLDVYAEAK